MTSAPAQRPRRARQHLAGLTGALWFPAALLILAALVMLLVAELASGLIGSLP